MPVEKDEGRIGRLLSDHADRRHLDVDAFVTRVMSEVDASPGGLETSRASRTVAAKRGRRVSVRAADREIGNEPARRRLLPVMMAVSVLAVAVAASSVPAVARWAARDEGIAVVRPASLATSTSQEPSASQSHEPTESTPTPSPAAATGVPTAGARPDVVTLPSTFRWRSSAALLPPRVESDTVTGLKDPTVVRYGGKWHVFVTTVNSSYGLAYLSFNRWSDASTAQLHPLSSSPMGSGFRATPQVFYFAPQKLWYLVYQTGTASYSTNPDINDPNGWSAPKDFYDGIPDLVQAHLDGGFWVSMWVICDKKDCYLFSSDSRGQLFRSQTSRTSFPRGMSKPVVAVDDSRQGTSLAASHVYRVTGTGRYLLLGQAFGGDGHGYLRSWTATRLTGPWTSQTDNSDHPFAGASNVTSAAPWTSDIVDGELVRDGYDQNLSVSPCQLQLLYLGLDRRFSDNRSFGLGLLTQTNSTCG